MKATLQRLWADKRIRYTVYVLSFAAWLAGGATVLLISKARYPLGF